MSDCGGLWRRWQVPAGEPPEGKYAGSAQPRPAVIAASICYPMRADGLLWLDQVGRWPAGGGVGGVGEAQLQQHLRGPWQSQAVPDQGADRGCLQRLRV